MRTRVSEASWAVRSALVAGAVGVLAASAGACDPDDAWKLKRKITVRGPILTQPDFEGDGSMRDEFPRENVELLAWIPLNNFPGNNSTAADCWGYTSSSGREYALIGLRNGTGVVEVTDPLNPVIVRFVAGASSLWHDVTVVGHYAYACTDVEDEMGIQVIDLSDVDNGNVRLVGERHPSGLSTIHTLLSNPETGRLFACGSNISNGGCVVLDVATDPENPVVKGAWTTRYVHECQVLVHQSGPYAGQEIAYLFAAGPYYGYDKAFATARINADGSVTGLSHIAYTGMEFCHQGALTPDYRYLYVNDELDEYFLGVPPSTHMFDVSDLSSPQYLGKFTRAHNSIDHNEYVNGKYLYQSNYMEGLHVYDISDPLAPAEVAWIDTYPNGSGIDFEGNWGNYPYFESGTIVLSDMNRGLFLVRLDLPCTADFNDDGQQNVFDFLAYQTAFGEGDPSADLAAPFGVLNVFDFLAFQSAFGEGC